MMGVVVWFFLPVDVKIAMTESTLEEKGFIWDEILRSISGRKTGSSSSIN